jgi:hypothetical protein
MVSDKPRVWQWRRRRCVVVSKEPSPFHIWGEGGVGVAVTRQTGSRKPEESVLTFKSRMPGTRRWRTVGVAHCHSDTV